MEKRELLYTVGENVHFKKNYGEKYEVSSKLKVELPYYTAFPLLSIYLGGKKKVKTLIQKDACNPKFQFSSVQSFSCVRLFVTP